MPDKVEFESIRCPLCDGAEAAPWLQAPDRLGRDGRRFRLVRCGSCALIYLNPRPTASSIGHYYGAGYYEAFPGRGKSRSRRTLRARVSQRLEARQLRRRLRSMCGVVGRPEAGQTLLEIGTANGAFLAEARRSGWQVAGVETSENAASYARETHGLQVFHGDVLDYHPPASFDRIVLWGVLPHLADPRRSVERIRELLRPGGTLVLCAANIDGLAARWMGSAWGHLDLPRHYCHYSPVTLRRLVEAAGLEWERLVFDDRIFNSRLDLPGLVNLRRAADATARRRSGAAGTIAGYAGRALQQVNHLGTLPILALARWAGAGGIMIAIVRRPAPGAAS